MKAMKTIVGFLAVTFAVAVSAAPATASKPVKLTKSEMASITAGTQPQSGQPGYTEGQPGTPKAPPPPGHTGTTGANNNNPH